MLFCQKVKCMYMSHIGDNCPLRVKYIHLPMPIMFSPGLTLKAEELYKRKPLIFLFITLIP